MLDDVDVPRVYTDSEQLSGITEEYVCWLDLMAVRGTMSRSLETSAITILNLHVAIDDALDRETMTHYPIMDGVYLTSENKWDMLNTLGDIFSKIAKDNIENANTEYMYIPRASLSFGPILHGKNIPEELNREFVGNSDYIESILLGLPMIQAVENEPNAPPFGIYVDKSARAFAPGDDDPIETPWHRWFRYIDEDADALGSELYDELSEYYKWCKSNSNYLEYPEEDIEKHKSMAEEYLTQ
ncbi:hypothetical protein [Natrinema salifodinae]|uniref:Uncharacterized protein n=2 Tax=Halobacteriales TaxID=2235 RepID=A0A1I0Q7F9_9EURY|nr:hypothetical protein [Natrinema salifodinae]SEW22886.1 hypothetical protein SAMN05216285_3188 [Natrinema salifodinae]